MTRVSLKPLTIDIPGKGTTANVPRIVNPIWALESINTILDPNFQKYGGAIQLPEGCHSFILKNEIREIKIPPCPVEPIDHLVRLDDIAVRVNNLLRVITEYSLGNKPVAVIQKSLDNLCGTIATKIGSKKKGLIISNVIGSRMAFSMRAVIVPDAQHHPVWVGIPETFMSKLKMDEGDLIIVGRDPVIHGGSIEVLQATPIPGHAIQLHPLVFGQMGADSDGDTVWAMVVDKQSLDCIAEAEAQILSFTIKHSKYAKNMAAIGDSKVNWKEVEKECGTRFQTTGFSVSPDDILTNSTNLKSLENYTGKNLHDECINIIDGKENVEEKSNQINLALLIQKSYLGRIGAASAKLKLIASSDPVLLRSADYVSERSNQELFDAKGKVNSGNETVDIFEVLNLINMRGVWRSTIEEPRWHYEAAKAISTSDCFDIKNLWAIFAEIYTVRPVRMALLSMNKSTLEARSHLRTEYNYNKTYNKDNLKNMIETVARKANCDKVQLMRETMEFKASSKWSLGFLVNNPIYNMANSPTPDNLIAGITYVRERLGGTSSKKKTDMIDRMFDYSMGESNV
jgi:hypothetical protein